MEYHQLFEACSLNTSLKKKQLFEFIVEEIKPFIIAQGFGINYSNCVKLIEQMIRLDFYDKELWSLALNKLEYKIRFNNLIFIQSFYDKLLKSKDCGKNPHDLTKILTKLKNKLGSKVDYRWRYNLEENRFYTFQELKSNRDNYNFPEQSMNLKSPFQKRRLKLFKKKTDATSELKAKKKKMTLEKELEELTFERFIKNKTLEDQQLEDSESPSTEKELEEEKEIEDFLINRDKNRRKQKKNYEKQDLDITQSKEEEKQLTPEELEENERKEIKAEKEAARKKMMLERKKKDNAKLGKGKNKALGKMMKDQDFEQSGDR